MGKWKNDYNINRKYIPSWEEGREWLTCTEDGRSFCRLCNCSFTSKISTVRQHEKSLKHKKLLGSGVQTNHNIKLKTGICVSKQEYHADEKSDPSEYNTGEAYDSDNVENSKTIHIPCLDYDKSTSKVREFRIIQNVKQQPPIMSNLSDEMTTSFKLSADSKFIIINGSSPNLLSNISNEDPSDSLVQSITNTFKTDVQNFLRRNNSITEYIHNNPDFSEGEAGISRLTRMLVGQMAQQYLMDYTVESWRSRTHPSTSNLVSSKLSKIEKTMEQSVQEMKTIKAQFDAQELLNQSGILLDSLNVNF